MFEAVGHVDAPILFVMLSPPFDKNGESERMKSWFWKKCYAAGIKKTQVRIVYMLDEPPAGSGGKPLVGQVREARERFEREIAESNPEVVIPMGTEAFQALTGIKEGIFDARGYVLDKSFYQKTEVSAYRQIGVYKSKGKNGVKGDPKFKWVRETADCLLASKDVTVIPTFTLDHIRTEQFSLAPVLKEDLLRAVRVIEGKLHLIDENFTYYSTLKELKNVVWGDIIAVDIETHGVDNDVIDLISFSDGVVSCSLEWCEEVRAYTEKVFKLKGRTYAVHNSPFDLPRLVAQGVRISKKVIERQVYDTMFGGVVIQPDLHKSLGRMASLYLDCRPWKTSNLNMDSPWRVMAHADPRLYSAKDSFYTTNIAKVQIVIMKKLGTWGLFMGQDGHPGPGVMATIPVLTQMTTDGIPLNREYAAWWCPILERHQLKLEKLWSRHFPGVNPHSTKDLKKLFHGEWGLPLQKTREDTISTDELALISLSAFVEAQRSLPTHKGDWKKDPRCNKRTFDLILRIRDVSKTLGTYVTPVFLEEKPSVHPQYLPVSKDSERGENKNSYSASKGNTATGRLASSRPNIQNQPKKTRVLYVPEGDQCFIEADYKSAELYVQAYLAGDKKLITDLNDPRPGGMHQLNANMLGIVRDTAKNVTYASQYLAGPTKQSEMILKQANVYVSPSECHRISTAIWGKYTDVTAYKNYLISLCDTKRFLLNPFKRPRAFHDGRSAAAVNFIPQSTVADVLWCVLKPVADMARRYGGRMYTTVHDSILIAVPQEHVAAAAKEMRKIMEQKFPIVAPGFYIPVELKVAGPGRPWSEVKEYKEAA